MTTPDNPPDPRPFTAPIYNEPASLRAAAQHRDRGTHRARRAGYLETLWDALTAWWTAPRYRA